jgi:hypothetical protein
VEVIGWYILATLSLLLGPSPRLRRASKFLQQSKNYPNVFDVRIEYNSLVLSTYNTVQIQAPSVEHLWAPEIAQLFCCKGQAEQLLPQTLAIYLDLLWLP